LKNSTNPKSKNERGPLEGIRVLEFAQIAAGPFAGALLADLGADVVKIERPDGGDGLRQWPPIIFGQNGEKFSGNFVSVNRNKRSVAVDPKNSAHLADLYRLVESADVFIENYRPGVMKRLGLDYDTLKKKNPRLVYCSITGYGQTGPYAMKGAFDVTVQAMSGLMSVTGEEGRDPVKCGVPVGDFAAGLYAAFTIVSAVRWAQKSGQGTHIDCSMLGSLLGIAALQTSEYFGTGIAPKRYGSAHPRNAPYQAFNASDRAFTVAAGNDKLWQALCDVAGRKDLVVDPRFLTQADRMKNQKALAEILSPIFATRPAHVWIAEFDAQGVPCAPVLDYEEILADHHVEHMKLVQEIDLPNGALTKTVAFPLSMSQFQFGITRRPPALGEHTEEVLKEWGAASLVET
jgi:crotonobetainyl-CoA:carnitine CoA-transferase CaiB-like acyl-CoA transferase